MPTFTGSKIKNTYARLFQISQVGNFGLDATVRNVEDGFGVASPIRMSSTTFEITGLFNVLNKQTITALLNAAAGNEIAFSIVYTVNKLAGDSTGLFVNMLDSASPGTDRLLDLQRDSVSQLNVRQDGTVVTLSGYSALNGVNHVAYLGGNLDGTDGLYLGSTSVIRWDADPSIFGLHPRAGLSMPNQYVVKVTDGASAYGTLAAGGLNLGGDTAVTDGKGVVTATLNDAAGDEIAFKLDVTINKVAGSGYGYLVEYTDTLSPSIFELLTVRSKATPTYKPFFVSPTAATVQPFGEGFFRVIQSSAGGALMLDSGPTASTHFSWQLATPAAGFKRLWFAPATAYASSTNTTQYQFGDAGVADISGAGTDQVFLSVQPNVAMSGAGAHTDLQIRRAQTSAGSGLQNLLRMMLGSTTRYRFDTDGKTFIDGVLDNATGDEVGFTLNLTVNKASSGTAHAIEINITDTASPSDVWFLRGTRGGNNEALITSGAGEYPGFWCKWWSGSGGWANVSVNTAADSGKQVTLFANGGAAAGALVAGDVGLYATTASNIGIKFLWSNIGSYTYAPVICQAVRLGEAGGGNAVDAGIRRYAASVAQIFNGNYGTPTTAKLMVSALVAPDGSPDALTIDNDGKVSADVELKIPTASCITYDTSVLEAADTVTLANNVVTDVFDIALASGEMVGGTVSYTIYCQDAAPEYQVHTGVLVFSAVNKAGTITTDLVHAATLESDESTSGTISDTFTLIDNTGKITLRLNANSSLTPTSLFISYKLVQHSNKVLSKKA